MPQNRTLEVAQPLARLNAQLADESIARRAKDGECLRLATGRVEGQHQLLAKGLAERIFGTECRELLDDLRVHAEVELGADAQLQCREAQIFESGRIAPELLVREVRECWAPPERKRLLQTANRVLGPIRGQKVATLTQRRFEPEDVDRIERDLESISRCARHEQLPGRPCRVIWIEEPAQRGDLRLDLRQ